MESQSGVYRRVQGLIGQASYSVVLPKEYAENLGIVKGTFVRVHQEGTKIVMERAERET